MHVYRSRLILLHTPYLRLQDADIPLTSLLISELSEWKDKLHTPLDFNVAYPVNKLFLRYCEELHRLMMYQISRHEQSLANLDYDFQQLLSIIGAMSPNFLPQAR